MTLSADATDQVMRTNPLFDARPQRLRHIHSTGRAAFLSADSNPSGGEEGHKALSHLYSKAPRTL